VQKDQAKPIFALALDMNQILLNKRLLVSLEVLGNEYLSVTVKQ